MSLTVTQQYSLISNLFDIDSEKDRNGVIIERKHLATINEEVTWLWLSNRSSLFYQMQSKFV